MPVKITTYHANDQPLEEGTILEILGDGKPVARSTVGKDGTATFEVERKEYRSLSVRMVPSTPP